MDNNEVRIVEVCTCWGGYEQVRTNGECPECGSPTLNGDAAYIDCVWSPESCGTCGQCECDGSC